MMSPSPSLPRAAEEVVEADLVQRRGRGVGRDVAADAVGRAVGAHDHRHRVPADEALDAALDLVAAGERRLLLGTDRVDVGRDGGERQADARPCGAWCRSVASSRCTRSAIPLLDDVVERLEPLPLFDGLELGGVASARCSSWTMSVLGPSRPGSCQRLTIFLSLTARVDEITMSHAPSPRVLVAAALAVGRTETSPRAASASHVRALTPHGTARRWPRGSRRPTSAPTSSALPDARAPRAREARRGRAG